MKITETMTVLTYLSQAFPQLQPTEERLAVWHDVIGHLDPGVAEDAARRLTSEDRSFPPTPGNLLGIAQRVFAHGVGPNGELYRTVSRARSRNPAIIAARRTAMELDAQ